MNTLQWFNFDDTDVDSFRVYRSIPGIQFLFSSVITDFPIFRFAVSHEELQRIELDKTTATSLANSLNMGSGILANVTGNGLSIQVRLLTADPKAKLKVYPSDFATDIGYPRGAIIVPELNFTVLDDVPFVVQAVPPVPYTFIDQDGSELDTYRVTSIKGGNESLPSITQKAMLPGVAYCIAEARFINIQGRPVYGVEAWAYPAVLDTSGLSTNVIKTVSDEFGRIALPLLQNQPYRIDIPAAGHSRFILTPEADFIDLTIWPSTTGPEYSPNGDPV